MAHTHYDMDGKVKRDGNPRLDEDQQRANVVA